MFLRFWGPGGISFYHFEILTMRKLLLLFTGVARVEGKRSSLEPYPGLANPGQKSGKRSSSLSASTEIRHGPTKSALFYFVFPLCPPPFPSKCRGAISSSGGEPQPAFGRFQRISNGNNHQDVIRKPIAARSRWNGVFGYAKGNSRRLSLHRRNFGFALRPQTISGVPLIILGEISGSRKFPCAAYQIRT
jgi:hypothetical protein